MPSLSSASVAAAVSCAALVAVSPRAHAEEPSAHPPAPEPPPAETSVGWTALQQLERPEARESGPCWDDGSHTPYYTAPLAPLVVGLRAVPSFGLQIQDGSVEPRFVMDVVLSLRAPLHRGYSFWALWPELAYSGVTPGDRGGHELAAGLGFGRVFDGLAALRWAPWIVGEVADSERLGLGLRNSVIGSLYDILSLELSHEWIAFKGGRRHDVRLGCGIDLLVVVTRAASGEGLEP